MNSSLQRFCKSRERLAWRSKNLERRILVLPSGAELFLGMRPEKAPGRTFNAGLRRLKASPHAPRDMRAVKEEVWDEARRHG
jgi:hypothetical protein